MGGRGRGRREGSGRLGPLLGGVELWWVPAGSARPELRVRPKVSDGGHDGRSSAPAPHHTGFPQGRGRCSFQDQGRPELGPTHPPLSKGRAGPARTEEPGLDELCPGLCDGAARCVRRLVHPGGAPKTHTVSIVVAHPSLSPCSFSLF